MSLATGRKRAGVVKRGVVAPRSEWGSLGWAGLSQIVGMVIRLGSNLILTRLLVPEAYGLFATAMAVVTTLEWLSDLGIQPALVRHPEGGGPTYLSTGWWLGLGRGFTLSAVTAVLAWPLAMSYGQPALAPILAALALRPAFNAIRSPGMPVLRRTLNYRALFFDEVAQTVVATAVSLTLAWMTRSLWSIVAGTLAGVLAGVVVSYVLCPVAPGFVWSRTAAREIARLGRQVFANTIIMAFWLNTDRLLGLHLVGSLGMGLFAVAWNLSAMIEGLITKACDAYFSMLSRRTDPEAQAAWHVEVSRRVSVMVMPAMALGCVIAPRLIDLLYDRRYSGARFVFGVMFARLMIRGLGQIQFQYLLATDRARVGTRANLAALIAQALILVPLAHWGGAPGLAVAGLISTTILTGIQTLSLEFLGVRSVVPFVTTVASMAVGLLLMVLL